MSERGVWKVMDGLCEGRNELWGDGLGEGCVDYVMLGTVTSFALKEKQIRCAMLSLGKSDFI